MLATAEAIASMASYSERKQISVIVPCLNEEDSADNLSVALERLEGSLSSFEFQFIIVDDGSTDRSVEDLRFLFRNKSNVRLIEHGENRGIAAAIRTGILAAETEIVCSMDFDCTYDPVQFANLLPAMTDGVDLVTASPYHPEGRVLNVPAWRLMISRCASTIYRILMRPDLYTYTSCFRVYRKSSIANIELIHNGFVGVAELLWRLDNNGGKIVEIPAVLDVRQFGQSKMRVVEVTAAHLRLLARILIGRVLQNEHSESLLETSTDKSTGQLINK